VINQAGQNSKVTFYDHISLTSLIKGIIVSYIITIPAFIIFALLLSYIDFPEKYISSAVLIATIVSLLVAGSTATRNVKNKGWLNGAIVGLIYMLVLYIFSGLVFKNFTIDRQVIIMAVIGVLCGAIGGIIGINFKRNSSIKHRR